MSPLSGFSSVRVADGELWFADGFEAAARELGLAEHSRWVSRIEEGIPGGRGKIAFVESSGRRLALKQLRRGGVAGSIWRDRFSSRERLIDNLSIPKLARDRGVATPAALALLIVPGPPAWWRGWLAIETVPNAPDLRKRLPTDPPSAAEWSDALAAVRKLHDAGIEHPDLNLGNVLVDAAGRGWVIDLDRSTVHDRPLDIDRRIDGIRRIERSYLKTCFVHELPIDTGIDWLRLYASKDASMAERWSQRHESDLTKLRRHRRAWRR